MSSDPQVWIRASGLGKAYFPWSNRFQLMLKLLLGRTSERAFWALRDVSFSVSRGECLGIVGRNGAGKSTFLQLVCGTHAPSRGRMESRGRMAAMLELGAGFNPEFTGRENARLSAAIHGLTDRQIEERLPDIEAFAGIGDFMDRPVREYSSGMYARLAFAVCAHVDADILIIDEILGVGDAVFQAGCRRFLEDFLKRGAVIFVSHDEHAVLSICTRALWLEQGRPMAEGAPDEVLRLYRNAVDASDPAPFVSSCAQDRGSPEGEPAARAGMGSHPVSIARFRPDAPSHGHGGASIEDTYFAGPDGLRLDQIQAGSGVALVIEGRAHRDIEKPIVGFIFRNAAGQNLFGDNTFVAYRDRHVPIRGGRSFRAVFEFDMPMLARGVYTIAPSIIEGTQQNHIQLFWMEDAVTLAVTRSSVTIGKIGVPMRISAIVNQSGS
jgi:lipopolysaccharide transport system ATP-binding protein